MDSNLDIAVFLLKIVIFLKVYAFSTCSLISQPIFSLLFFFHVLCGIFSQHNWNYFIYFKICVYIFYTQGQEVLYMFLTTLSTSSSWSYPFTMSQTEVLLFSPRQIVILSNLAWWELLIVCNVQESWCGRFQCTAEGHEVGSAGKTQDIIQQYWFPRLLPAKRENYLLLWISCF